MLVRNSWPVPAHGSDTTTRLKTERSRGAIEMLTIAYPWLLLLIPLPLVARRMVPAYRESRQAVRTPWFQRLATLPVANPSIINVAVPVSDDFAIFFTGLWSYPV